ncbi:MAG: hypothetical protein H6700_13035, partial [Myxococcales bacterium]|nr:hypothetical protein [Myxococcales bacterium]
MNCEDCNQRLLDYAYEELDAPDRAAVEEALARCPQCREELAAIRTTMAAYSQLDALDVPAKLHADIVRSARLAAADARPERSWLGSVLASPVFGVALSVSLLAGGVWMFERLTSRSPALDGAGAEQAAVAAGERPSPEAEVPGAQPERPTAPAAAPVEAPIDEGGAFDQRAAPSEETPLNRDLAEGVVAQPSLDAAAPAAAARTTTREEPGNLRGGSMVTLGGTLGGGRTANEDTAAGRTGSSTGYGAVGGSAGYGAAAGAAPAGAMEAEMPDVVAPAPAPPAREAAAPAQPARIAEADSATERADSDELFAMADDAVRQQEQQASTRERRPRRGGADAPAAAEPMAPAARESEEVVELSSATTRSSASAGAAAPAATAAPA